MAKSTENGDDGVLDETVVTNETAAIKKPAERSVTQNEPQYSAADLADAARKRFGVPPEAAAAALKEAGKTSATATEAEKLIKHFMERKVQ